MHKLSFLAAALSVALVSSALAQQSIVPTKTTMSSEQCVQAQSQCAPAKPKTQTVRVKKNPGTPTPITRDAIAGTEGLPNAAPGQCFARIFYEPEYRDDSAQVLKRAAFKKVDVVPARFADEEEVVTVREASSRLEVVPATYKTISEEIVVSPAGKTLERVPGAVETVNEQVLVTPARAVWKRGVNIAGAPTMKDANGDILCLVEEPAVYKTVARQVRQADSVREIDVPEVRRTISKVVVDTPASTREVPIPAVTKTIKVRKMVEAARETSQDVPAEYAQVASRTMVRPGGWEWKQVLCETNSTPAKLAEIQTALRAKGLQTDADLKSVLDSLNAYRTAQGIRRDNYITVDTLKHLGVTEK